MSTDKVSSQNSPPDVSDLNELHSTHNRLKISGTESMPTLEQCPWAETSSTRTLVVRLLPGMHLKHSLLEFCKVHRLTSAFISTCVGSLTRATLRLADGKQLKKYEGPFEIISLVGVIANDHGHLHISLADRNGHVIGGHLVNEDIVYTTAELVITQLTNISLDRKPCKLSGWPELNVSK